MQIQPLTYTSIWILFIGLPLGGLFIGGSVYAYARNPGHKGSTQGFMIGLGIVVPTLLIALLVPESVLFPLACISGLILGGASGFLLSRNPNFDPWPPNPIYDWHNPNYHEILLGKERFARLTPSLRTFVGFISLVSIGLGLLCLVATFIRWLGW